MIVPTLIDITLRRDSDSQVFAVACIVIGLSIPVTPFVKINSITSCIRNGVDKSLFVDDFGVSYRSKHMQAIDRQLQFHLNRIEDWADNKLFLSQTLGNK